ncbi:MAG: MFS transporter, partial [Synergistaceae bacterium]|nr:MFS transporter [Synergistaceae bacterium]
ACLGFGISVVFFSFASNIYTGIALAAPVGFCMVTSTISCNTLLQSMVPASSRSRIMALYTMAILGIPPFGSLLSGKLGDHLGTDWALFICGSISAVIAYYFLVKIDRIRDQISAALEDPEAVKW